MVRYSKEHKEEVRRRILDAASRAFRRGGLTEVSIPALMGEVGLTHGGFYAHFDSKDALVAEACAHGLAQTARDMDEAARGAPEGRTAGAIIERYLSRGHRDDPGQGCVMPTLGGQVARQGPEVRREFTEALEEFLGVVGRHLEPGAKEASDEALVLASGLAGAMLLARAVDDERLSDRILRAARDFYLEEFAAGE